MKRSLRGRLTAVFLTFGLVMTLAVGLMFLLLFGLSAYDNREADLTQRAGSIADIMKDYTGGGSVRGMPGGMNGVGGLLRYLETLDEERIWILDARGEPLTIQTMGMGMMDSAHSRVLSAGELPDNARAVLGSVLAGKTEHTRNFSSIYETATLTVGVPVTGADGKVLGAVLIHAPVRGITRLVLRATGLMGVSLLITLILAAVAGLWAARRLTLPIAHMAVAAEQMAGGDLTARTGVRREDELGRLAGTLDAMAENLEKTLAQLSEEKGKLRDLFANVSHEFRTPLTVLRGSLEAMQDGVVETGEDRARHVARMLSETRVLERLVRDLMDLARLQADPFAVTLAPVVLNQLMQDIARSFPNLTGGKILHLDLRLPETPVTVSGDADRLRQLFVIFLDNACKHSPDESTLTFSLELAEGSAVVTVADQGPGIPPEVQSRIWDRFFKADRSRGATPGTGLGLAIAGMITDRHGATASVVSAPGEGAAFSVRFRQTAMPAGDGEGAAGGGV